MGRINRKTTYRPAELEQHFVPVIDRMIENGRPFHEIEDYIDDVPLSDSERTVLWLVAWSSVIPDQQRRKIVLGYDLSAAELG